jgi:hypothetical protein
VAQLPDVVGQCSASTGTPPTATDNCSGTITATTSDPTTYSAQGTYTITWTYKDASGNISTQTQKVIVKDTTQPVPNVASLPAVTGQCSATVTAAPTATDNCAGTVTATTSDPLTYTSQGTFTVHWTYNDGNGNSSTQTQTVIVQDTTPPTITGLSASPSQLWPVDHKMVDVTINYTATDNCGGPVTSVLTVSSNQGTSDDWQVVDAHHVKLHAERNGNNNDRIYTITVKCSDSNGNMTTMTVTVTVPHDQGN